MNSMLTLGTRMCVPKLSPIPVTLYNANILHQTRISGANDDTLSKNASDMLHCWIGFRLSK